ncbi:MAG: PAS domain S-box protein [Gemmatimonadota bacterium]|nr:PAS domain S-box protein [Gemmatimonadota bacterium]
MRTHNTGGGEPISEGIFEKILQMAADAIVTVNEAQIIVHFNLGAEQIFGYSAAEVIGRPLGVLLPPQFREMHTTYVNLFGQSSEAARLMGHRREVYGLRKDGTDFPAEASILKLDAPGGRRLYTALVRDVTDRTRMDQQQRFLAEVSAALSGSLEYQATLESVVRLPVPALADICILDVLDESGSLRRLAHTASGASGNESPLDGFALSADAPAVQIDALRSRRTEVVSVVTDEWLDAHCELPDEANAWRALRVRSILAVPLVARNQALGVVTLMAVGDLRRFAPTDVLLAENYAGRAALAIDNARLYRDALRATRARDDVLGVVSHDLRNPLSAIAMCSRVLADSPPADDAARRDLARTIHESTSWMSRMIQDLLDISAIEAGSLAVVLRREAVAPIIDRAVKLFANGAEERGVEIVVAPADPELIARADSERMAQAVANLIGNALKFTPSGGRIVVGAQEADGEVAIAVTDTGSGISGRDLPHIFDRYWHSRGSSAGAGLGLAIVSGIMSAHGGRVAVESVPGAGSRFSLFIPMR